MSFKTNVSLIAFSDTKVTGVKPAQNRFKTTDTVNVLTEAKCSKLRFILFGLYLILGVGVFFNLSYDHFVLLTYFLLQQSEAKWLL